MAPAACGARRVLVTGAAGFIGCRLVEVLHQSKEWQVRALVHNPSQRRPAGSAAGGNGARRSEVPGRRGEGGGRLRRRRPLRHWHRLRPTKEIFAVTVGGTRNLVNAAQAASVQRFVHLSSIAVHGNDVASEIIDESTPIRPPKGDDYSESKAAAEGVIRRAAGAGLSSIVLRPGNVYGPFSKTFIVRPLQYLIRNALVLAGSSDTPSNTVYVDNLVRAIVCAQGAG